MICLTDEEAVDLVQEALRQILNLHKDFALKYFHIGADEVFQVCFITTEIAYIFRTAESCERRSIEPRHKIFIDTFIRLLIVLVASDNR